MFAKSFFALEFAIARANGTLEEHSNLQDFSMFDLVGFGWVVESEDWR